MIRCKVNSSKRFMQLKTICYIFSRIVITSARTWFPFNHFITSSHPFWCIIYFIGLFHIVFHLISVVILFLFQLPDSVNWQLCAKILHLVAQVRTVTQFANNLEIFLRRSGHFRICTFRQLQVMKTSVKKKKKKTSSGTIIKRLHG